MNKRAQVSLNAKAPLENVVRLLRQGSSFLLLTHKGPDIDGIGSMLALGKSLVGAGKEAVLFVEKPIAAPLSLMKGADKIIYSLLDRGPFDAILMLDCSTDNRDGGIGRSLESSGILINIDHHISNDFYGDYNLVETESSSTGEIVFKILKAADFPIDADVAENIFAAIQADTGCFRYDNTTGTAMEICAEMINYGVRPWELSRRLVDFYTLPRLRLLEAALGTVEFYLDGKVGMITVLERMMEETGAVREDSESFVDYPRCVPGVEISVLVRQTGIREYKFSLRSNDYVDVAELAGRFGGGGHVRAAGYECHGNLVTLKREFLEEAHRFMNQVHNDAI